MDTPMSPVARGAPERAAIERQLARILASSSLRQSRRRCDLLRWSVERFLNGNTEPVKEYEIGLAVFGKSEDWDPRTDPIVRVEFNRLRQKLREFYAGEGYDDPILIDFPARGYVPVFTERVPAARRASAETPDFPATQPRRSRLLSIVIGAVALVAAGTAIFRSFHPAVRQPPVSSIAVLPFLDLSPGHQYEYLSDGFADELTNALAMLNGLRVISRTSAFQFKSKNVDVREVGRALQVGSIVEGSILRVGGRIRVIVQLNRTADGSHLWQAQYDRETKDILAVQDEITHAVAEALRVRLTGAPEIAAESHPPEPAVNEYLKGIYEGMKNTPDSQRAAIAHFENAIRLAPKYALAYAGIGSAYLGLTGHTGPAQKTDFEQARNYLNQAVSLDPRLAAPHAALALIRYVLDWDWPAAENEFRQALALASTGNTHRYYAFALTTRGRFAEAEDHYRQALQLDPLNLLVRYNFAIMFHNQGRDDEARKQLQFCLDRDPNYFLAHLQLGYVAVGDHRPQEALEHFRRATALVPNTPMVAPEMAAAYAEAGQRSQALALMREIEKHAADIGYVRMHLAVAKACLGDTDGVFYWLERSVDAHEQQALYIRFHPVFAPYQHDPRMLALERRVGLIP